MKVHHHILARYHLDQGISAGQAPPMSPQDCSGPNPGESNLWLLKPEYKTLRGEKRSPGAQSETLSRLKIAQGTGPNVPWRSNSAGRKGHQSGTRVSTSANNHTGPSAKGVPTLIRRTTQPFSRMRTNQSRTQNRPLPESKGKASLKGPLPFPHPCLSLLHEP